MAVLLAIAAAPFLSGRAAGQESLSDLEARMETLQGELDAATARIEELRGEADMFQQRIDGIASRMDELGAQEAKLRSEVVKRADELYRSGNAGMIEALFGSDSFSEMTMRADILQEISSQDAAVFVELSRSQAELERLEEDIKEQRAQLAQTTDTVIEEAAALEARFDEVAAEYEDLKSKLAAQAPAPSSGGGSSAPAIAAAPISTNGKFCPVAGPTSFIDSWGAPRSGHTHQGVDMMGSYGTPLVAVTSGTITYAAYDGSGGNMIFLSGDDGNAYWYMHNQENLVTGGHVQAGQQIATLGDTGNAAGTPHLHFEYHPGGGAAVNPYPLVASLC